MTHIIDNLLVIASIIAIIFLFILFLRIIRFLYYFIRCFYLSQRYKPKYDKETRKILANKYSKPDSPLQRDKETEIQLKNDIEKLTKSNELTNKSETKIVDIAKPIGMWTEFVTKQKLSWLRAMIGSKAESDKFWQNIVQAQEQAQGKKKGRGR